MLQRAYGFLLAVVVAVGVVAFPAPADAQSDAVRRCQREVRSRVWHLRGDRSPVRFTSVDTYRISSKQRGVRGSGYVRAPGASDRFAYDCSVVIRTGAVRIRSLRGAGHRPIGPGYPQPPAGWTGNAATTCHAVVRDRIWRLRRDRSPVQFTSTDVYSVSNYQRRVRGTGQVFAPRDIDGFVYECSVGIVTHRVGILRLEGRKGIYPGFRRDPEHDR
jgi:hypothetical protein